MGNMSYCRFQNTLNDLRDCEENLNNDDLSKDEFVARKRLIELCLDIVQNSFCYDENTEDWEPYGDWNDEYEQDDDIYKEEE